MERRIGILTGGGDAPGQNVCLKSLVYRAIEHGFQVVGIRKGWEGLIRFNPDNPMTHAENTMTLTRVRTRDIDRLPGAFLHSSRVNPAALPVAAVPAFLRPGGATTGALDTTAHIQTAIDKLGLEGLVVLGDRGALSYAAHLSAQGVPVIGYTWFPMFTMIDWAYRKGRRPLASYLIHLGLYDAAYDADGVLRRQRTPLVDRFRSHMARPVPPIAAPLAVADGAQVGQLAHS